MSDEIKGALFLAAVFIATVLAALFAMLFEPHPDEPEWLDTV